MYDVITDRLRVIAYDVKIFRQVKAFDKCVDHERTNRKSEQGKQSGFYIENKKSGCVSPDGDWKEFVIQNFADYMVEKTDKKTDETTNEKYEQKIGISA